MPSINSLLAITALATSALAAMQTVTVAPNAKFAFDPPTIKAAAGDQVQFVFANGNHTVTSGMACKPDGAVNSGFIAVNNQADAGPNGQAKGKGKGNGALGGLFGRQAGRNQATFTMTVQDTNPMAIYCAQATHCQQGPMVMIINPADDGQMTLPNVQKAAQRARNNVPADNVSGGQLNNKAKQLQAKNAKGKGKGNNGGLGALLGGN
ncbi:hypothetical protein K402DRAFT_421629 [Aulographum hederae CBS 113979]|uniref:Cupredoxin n=1 Tax=Aulographum hederae CBS 113979 TaxID=1176131 RepID=A0A6G1GZB5_9PEZI|nr:hypothetical protein K402DRAFT_421629 [Aulographum hederae CBS 113979]